MQIEGWDFYKLDEIADINPSKSPRPENGLASFIPMESVSESAKMLNQQVKPYDEIEKGFTSFKNSDVLVAKITPCFENGKGALVENLENGIGFGSTEFHVLRANGKSISKYLYYLTNSHEFRIRGEMNMQGSAGQKRVTTDYLKSYKVNLPPLAEQKKIAEILSTWDKAIETVEKLVANSQQQKKALMQQLLTGQKRLLDENGNEFKEEWKRKSLKQLGEVVNGLTYSPSEVVTEASGTLVLRSSNIQNGKLAFDDNVFVNTQISEKQMTKENDILICVRNGSRSLIGKNALLKGKAVGCFHGAFMTIFRTDEPLFVYQLMQSNLFFKEVSKNLGATINSINGSDLRQFTFNMSTSQKEREKIAQVLTLADREIDLYQQQLDKLKLEKKSLMQQLLTGQKRVKLET